MFYALPMTAAVMANAAAVAAAAGTVAVDFGCVVFEYDSGRMVDSGDTPASALGCDRV